MLDQAQATKTIIDSTLDKNGNLDLDSLLAKKLQQDTQKMSPEASAPPAKVGQQAKLPEEKANPEQASLSNLDDILNAKLMEDNIAVGQPAAAPVAKVPAAPAKA